MRTRSVIKHVITFGAVGWVLSACVSYNPAEISAMSTYDICSAQVNQGSGLVEGSRRLLQSELERRKEDCRQYRAAIQKERDEKLNYYTYGQQSP